MRTSASFLSPIFFACSAEMGFPKQTQIGPREKSFLCLGQHSKAPSITVGRIAAPPRLHRRPKPGLKRSIRPSGERVPSGKRQIASPFLSLAMTFLMADRSDSPSLTGIVPTEEINRPKNQWVKSDARFTLFANVFSGSSSACCSAQHQGQLSLIFGNCNPSAGERSGDPPNPWESDRSLELPPSPEPARSGHPDLPTLDRVTGPCSPKTCRLVHP